MKGIREEKRKKLSIKKKKKDIRFKQSLQHGNRQHTSSVTWFALIVISSTDMSAILLLSKLSGLPLAPSSILWGLRVKKVGGKLIKLYLKKKK